MIKWYQSNQTGAPQLSGQDGALMAVLNACLLNGYNLRTLTKITRVGNVATAQADAGHGFRNGDTVRIDGAVEAAYNGDKVIRNVTTNTFDFDVTGDPASPASGTITAKIAPLDWTSPYTAAGKAVYRSKDPASCGVYLRVDETAMPGNPDYGAGFRTAVVQMWETMADVDNGTGMAQVFWRKGQNESTTARPWVLIGDSKRFWLCVAWSESYYGRYVPYLFGDFPSFKAGDGYNGVLAGYFDPGYNWNEPNGNEVCDWVYPVGTAVGNTGIWMARSYTQLGNRVPAMWVAAPGSSGAGIGSTGLPYPNPADSGIYVMPLLIQEQGGPSLRGRLPGMLCPLHGISAPEPWLYDGFVLDGTVRKLLVMANTQNGGNGRMAFDLTGPWE
jgi:hypothetical protein